MKRTSSKLHLSSKFVMAKDRLNLNSYKNFAGILKYTWTDAILYIATQYTVNGLLNYANIYDTVLH